MSKVDTTKYIFVTGGVVSSLGKGIVASSLGRLLKERGYKVTIQKFDPYLNVDPGTMSPYQHGEVFVTEDGAETDLDLGHYERFINENLTQYSNLTSGRIMSRIIAKERKGEFLGGTVQTVPHVTDEIKSNIKLAGEKTGADFEKAVDEGISKGAKSLIIDLRNNPGGLLTSVKQVADKLLPESTIMKIVDSKGKETIEKATGKGIDIPIVVLINKGSASASEVLSVALHDNKKATLVGEKSFGKGIIQSIFPINNGGKTEGIKMTVAEYFGPNGTKIHKVGLEPDYKVEQKNYSKIGIEHLDSDSQLKKAIELLK